MRKIAYKQIKQSISCFALILHCTILFKEEMCAQKEQSKEDDRFIKIQMDPQRWFSVSRKTKALQIYQVLLTHLSSYS